MAKIISLSSVKNTGDGDSHQSTVRDAVNISLLPTGTQASFEEIGDLILPVSIEDNEIIFKKVQYLKSLRFILNNQLYLQKLKDLEDGQLADLVKIALDTSFEQIQKSPIYYKALFDTIEAKKLTAIREMSKK
jgi:hypothetical protein